MTPEEYKNIIKDISSFADDEHDVISDNVGNIVFERLGRTMSIRVYSNEDMPTMVEYNDQVIPYKTFLAKELANLDILASRILQQYSGDDSVFIDSRVKKYTIDSIVDDSAVKTLSLEADEVAFVGTKISFVTADAGHGKSILLHQFQKIQSERYLNQESKYLFWHIDLHGRDLVRLNEAIMSELGELRVSGLYYSSILTLMRRHLIVLGIDGFDELAAEIGGETALSSLSNLVTQMEGRGIIIAASRRAFFNSQDYVKRSGILRKNAGAGCVLNEIRIQNWRREQCVDYLENKGFDSEQYDLLLNELKSEDHPLLERPYLFTKLINIAFEDEISPLSCIKDERLDSINDIIEAFIKREVQKWTGFDKETGKPYLSFDQHIRLLSEVAQEMWSSQNDIISCENLQLIITILFEEWGIEERLKPMILRMVNSHAFLVNVDGRDSYRRFDHVEFKNFFLARALEAVLVNAISMEDFKDVRSFLYLAQLPDSVAQYLVNHIDGDTLRPSLEGLLELERHEWKPTYVQPNVGTIIPFVLDKISGMFSDQIVVEGGIPFSSIVFEKQTINNVIFRNCSFINVSFIETNMINVVFDDCSFTDLRVSASSNHFENVLINDNCQINTLYSISGDDVDIEYAPFYIEKNLISFGIKVGGQVDNSSSDRIAIKNVEYYKIVKRFLNKYSRTMCIYESSLRDHPEYGFKKPDLVISDIIPLLEKYDIIESRTNNKTKQAGTQAWVLKKYNVSEVFQAEDSSSSVLSQFWRDVKAHE